MLNEFTIVLQSLETTDFLGKILSQAIFERRLQHIFMTGDLGSGKTTLTRAIVLHLPNAENCDVASPSFSLINYYPTRPQIQHADLYRCQTNVPDELLDNLENSNIVTLLEWSQFLKPYLWPNEVLHLTFNFKDALNPLIRSLNFRAYGDKTSSLLTWLKAALSDIII